MCAAVEFALDDAVPPAFQMICHCVECRMNNVSASVALVGWMLDNNGFKIVKGEEHLGKYQSSEPMARAFCKLCGPPVYNRNTRLSVCDTFPSLMPDFDFEPALHVYYGEKLRSFPDGLPKYADLPESFGGSGKLLDE